MWVCPFLGAGLYLLYMHTPKKPPLVVNHVPGAAGGHGACLAHYIVGLSALLPKVKGSGRGLLRGIHRCRQRRLLVPM